jgi:hypothetical protein
VKLAIMQPYFFPYLGYFQLVRAVDRFVFYDDVNYIVRGWISRNRILHDGKARLLTVPTSGASQNVPIDTVGVDTGDPRWKRRVLLLFQHAYAKAPHGDVALELLKRVLDTPARLIGELAKQSVAHTLELLGVAMSFVWSSAKYGNGGLHGPDRIVDICCRERASVYVNAPGGKDLYDPQVFRQRGIEMAFLQPELPPYQQPGGDFLAGLSILDVIAYAGIEETRRMSALGSLEMP